MMAREETQPRSAGGITLNTDWTTALGMALLLVICGLLLRSEVNKFVWGYFIGPKPFHRSFFSVFNKAFEVVVTLYFIMFAFRVPKRSAKIGSVLMGAALASGVLFSFIHLTTRAYHIAAVSGSAMRQIALVLFCVAIAEWFRSVAHWTSKSDSAGGQT